MTAICRWISRTISELTLSPSVRTQHLYFVRKLLHGASLGIGLAKCSDVQLEKVSSEGLTSKQCIKQACLLSVNSATTLLTTASSAVLDSCKEYKDSLTKILGLLEQLQIVEGENPDLWDAIVEERANINKAKAALTDLNSYMDSVEKVVNSTTEAAFLAGAEFVCTALCERLYSAQREISNQILELKKLEEDYVKIQKDIITIKKKDGANAEKPKSQKIVNVATSKNDIS